MVAMGRPVVIAIDGPAGAGKSTVARKVAERLGLAYVDSGATYRAAALKVLEAGVSPDDAQRVAAVVSGAQIEWVAPASPGVAWRVRVDGRDVTTSIRTPEVALAAAKISQLPAVRTKLVALQRQLNVGPGVVMEGRDIGTVVFPDADLKVFLDADPRERARRRRGQDAEEGRASTLEEIASQLERRDQLDAGRAISPLVPAPDAHIIDSTRLSPDQVVEKIIELARERALVEKAKDET
jgi:cytidylate kinase